MPEHIAPGGSLNVQAATDGGPEKLTSLRSKLAQHGCCNPNIVLKYPGVP